MTVINIEGVGNVSVASKFMSMSPDEQQAVVDHIKSVRGVSDAAPSVAARSDMTGSAPENADALQAGLAQKAQQMQPPGYLGQANNEGMRAVSEFLQSMNEAFNPSVRDRGSEGVLEGPLKTGKGVLSALGLPFAYPYAAASSLVANPMASAIHGVGDLLGSTNGPTQEQIYSDIRPGVETALSAVGTRGLPVPRSAPAIRPGQEVANAASRLSDVVGSPINVPRAIASDNMAVQRVGQGIRNIPIVGDAIPKATLGLTDALGDAVHTVAGEYGAGSGPNVASRIGNALGTAADAEAGNAAAMGMKSDAAVTGAWENANRSALQTLDATDSTALQRARSAVGDMSPQDMGATLIARLRQGEREAHATKERLYGAAAQSDGAIDANAVRGIRADVTRSLDDQGLVVDPLLTPAASRMVTELDNISSLRIPNRVASPTVGEDVNVAAVNMQGLEQTRKRLNALSQAASNDADRRASRHVIRSFDDWIGNAFDSALFSGSDDALQSYRAARAANTEWRQRFGFNSRDDADRIINRIVTGEVTPQEVSNYIVGSSKVGASGVSSRMLTRLAEATGGDPEALQTIRGGIFNRLTQSTEGVAAKSPEKVANDIHEFFNGSGRDVAGRVFTPEQRDLALTYADTLRRSEQGRAHVADVISNTKPGAIDVGIGPMQELATTVLGKGGKPDEAIFNAIDAYAKSGGRSDIHTLSRIVHSIPSAERGNLAGAIIRNIGVSPRTGQFSPDVFAAQWKTYTPQAKTILFGNAGPQRQAIDDIMLISERLKQVGQRFGNPSGTAQNVNLMALGGGLLTAPLTTISTAVGGAVAAKILAAPAGASSAAKWSRAYASVAVRPTAQTIAAFTLASRNLANTTKSLGFNVSPDVFMRAIQGPVQSRAQGEQP